MRSPCLRDPLRGRAAAALAVVGALWLGGAGCGLVSSDIDDFDLSIEEKSFTIDTSQWGLTDVDTFVNTDCSATPGVCATAAQQACTDGNCFGSCSTTTNTCELHVVVALWDMVVLTEEQPELQTIAEAREKHRALLAKYGNRSGTSSFLFWSGSPLLLCSRTTAKPAPPEMPSR